jgi:hypothetical protein
MASRVSKMGPRDHIAVKDGSASVKYASTAIFLIETFVCRATKSSGSSRNNRATIANAPPAISQVIIAADGFS